MIDKIVRKPRHDAELYWLRVRYRAGAFVLAALLAAMSIQTAHAAPNAGLVETATITSPHATSPANIDRIATRLRESLTADMLAHFHMFLYVNKADTGPFAQRMYVFQKTDSGDLALLYDWSVSTGREQVELDDRWQVQSTLTPRGFYEFDPRRFYADHDSTQWGEPMPFAMFFNWKPGGRNTGLAIHGAASDGIDKLGKRASAGCVRLAPQNAQTLFDLVRAQAKGPTPVLAYRPSADDLSSDGLLMHDQQGNLQMADNYPVLVLIEDYRGEDQVSSL